MPTLKETSFVGEIVWLGVAAAQAGSLRSDGVGKLTLGFEGVPDSRHYGAQRPSCVRVKNLYPQGTEIRNVRQLTILAAEELDAIAEEIGVDHLNPGLLGASIVLRGIPDFTHIPPSARLQGRSGVTVTVDMENRPCVLPGREIEADEPGHGRAFKAAATNRRGVTAWVERPGVLSLGDALTLFVPDQRHWTP